MVYAAIGGMQLKRFRGYFTIIMPTLRVLKAAKGAQGCLSADTFKAGDVYFAVSVWDSQDRMRDFAKDGLHGQLASMAMSEMAMFFNHTETYDAVPDRATYVTDWKAAIAARGGQGTVGSYGT